MPPIYQKEMLPKLAELLKAEKIDACLCVGDIFDKPKPEQRVKDDLLRLIVGNPDIMFVFTVGNHDYETKAADYHSLEYLKIFEPVNYLQNVFVVEPGNQTGIYLPGRTAKPGHGSDLLFDLHVLDSWEDVYNFDPEKCKSAGRPYIVAWHGTLPGIDFSSLGSAQETIDTEVKKAYKASEADYIALGDIHKRLPPYPGALVQKTFSCESGALVVEFGKDTYCVSLDLPKRVTVKIPPKILAELDVIKYVEDEVKDEDFVRLKFRLPLSKYSAIDKKEISEALSEKYPGVRIENDPVMEPANRVYSGIVEEANSIEEEFDLLIEEEDYGLEKKRLSKTCRTYVPK